MPETRHQNVSFARNHWGSLWCIVSAWIETITGCVASAFDSVTSGEPSAPCAGRKLCGPCLIK